MTQGGTKKPRAKKGAAKGKGGRKKAKKAEPEVEPEVIPAEAEETDATEAEEAPAPVPAKSTRGKKRGSAAVEDSMVSTASAPATKKRATRTRGSAMEDASTANDNTAMADIPPPSKTPAPKSGRMSKPRTGSNSSFASVVSMSSFHHGPEDFPDDDEIERQLEADLARESSADEMVDDLPSSPVPQAKQKTAKAKPATKKSTDYAMFDPEPMVAESSDVDEELEALQRQMESEAKYTQGIKVSKQGSKPGSRKVSKQVAKPVPAPRKVSNPVQPKVPSPPPHQEETEEEPMSSAASAIESELSEDDNDTIVQESPVRQTSASRGRSMSVVSHDSEALVSQSEAEAGETEADTDGESVAESVAESVVGSIAESVAESVAESIAESVAGSVAESVAESIAESVAETVVESVAESALDEEEELEAEDEVNELPPPKSRPVLKKPTLMNFDSSSPAPRQVINNDPTTSEFEAAFESEDFQVAEDPQSSPARTVERPSTPPRQTDSYYSPAPSAQQPVLSPSQSPQASDAENQPPSTAAKRPALAVLTPTREPASPSKRNVIAGLKTSAPWTAANLDAIFAGTNGDKENGSADKFLKQGKELSSDEKRMTVEQWIYFNAAEAEERLKIECENMVSRFETEGSRAMRSLEGLVVD